MVNLGTFNSTELVTAPLTHRELTGCFFNISWTFFQTKALSERKASPFLDINTIITGWHTFNKKITEHIKKAWKIMCQEKAINRTKFRYETNAEIIKRILNYYG